METNNTEKESNAIKLAHFKATKALPTLTPYQGTGYTIAVYITDCNYLENMADYFLHYKDARQAVQGLAELATIDTDKSSVFVLTEDDTHILTLYSTQS